MKTLLTKILVFLLCFASLTTFGQGTQSHTVYFEDMDGFSGHVEFTSSREGFATQLRGKGAILYINDYECSDEERAALQKAGINLWYAGSIGFEPKIFQVVVEGKAYVREQYYYHESLSNDKLRLDKGLGDFTTPTFAEDVQEHAKEWQRKYKTSYWESHGGFKAEKVTELYLSDLKNEIARVLQYHENQKQQFSTLLVQAKSAAEQYDFPQAESTLAQARTFAVDNYEMKEEISDVEDLIADKKEEKEKKDEEEKETGELNDLLSDARSALWKGDLETAKTRLEEAYKMDPQNETMIALSQEYAKLKEEKDEKEFDAKMEDAKTEQESEASEEEIYYPKSNRQLYDELKAMTDAHPEMLNDPKIRVRLNGYKAMADRDDRNMRDYQSFKMITGGGYHPQTSAALSSIYQTNSNIAVSEMGVNAVVDGATNIVNSIIDEQNRKNDERQKAESRKLATARAKKDAIAKWEYQLLENREAYEKETAKRIKENFDLVATIGDVPITYETEVYEEGNSYWQGQVLIFPHKFVKRKKVMASFNEIKTYNLYIVELNGLYGILDDDGEALYPPQFEGIYVLNVKNEDKRPRFLVNIKDKWGEILADGSIAEEIKYDGIWYRPDKKSKILKYNDDWQIKSLDNKHLLKQFSSSEILDLYVGGLIPVSNTNFKDFNKTGYYSLASDGIMYIWGESNDKNIVAIPSESVRREQRIEKLFEKNGQWFVTTNYGTNNMTMIEMPKKFVIEVFRETESGKKWGAINQNREIMVSFEYDEVKPIIDTLFLVGKNGKQGIIDIHGKAVIPIKYDAVAPTLDPDGLAGFRNGNNYGIVSRTKGEIFNISLKDKTPKDIDDLYVLGGLYFSGASLDNFSRLQKEERYRTINSIQNTIFLGGPRKESGPHVNIDKSRYFYSKISSESIWYELAKAELEIKR